jgi:hypothetical protein
VRVRVSKSALWKAIRKYCLWCCNGSTKDVRNCPKTECELWYFRMGPRKLLAASSQIDSERVSDKSICQKIHSEDLPKGQGRVQERMRSERL